jgi:hypothetical protein
LLAFGVFGWAGFLFRFGLMMLIAARSSCVLNMCRVMAASLSVHLTVGADAVGFARAISSLVGL